MKKRGSVLVAVLILLMVFFVMGLTVLGMKSTQAKSNLLMRYGVVAKYIAEAGIEDATLKLQKDIGFPPRDSSNDYYYSYSETVEYPGESSPGEFMVTVDSSKDDPALPEYDEKIILVSIGTARDPEGNILARHTIRALLDTRSEPRFNFDTVRNSYKYRIIDWQDMRNM